MKVPVGRDIWLVCMKSHVKCRFLANISVLNNTDKVACGRDKVLKLKHFCFIHVEEYNVIPTLIIRAFNS